MVFWTTNCITDVQNTLKLFFIILTYLFKGGFKSGIGLFSGSLGSSGSGVLGPLLSGGSLVGEHLGSLSLVLLFMDVLEEDSFVLVGVTLGSEVKLVVHVPVDLFVGSGFLEKPSENSHPLHPHVLDWSSGVGGTESLTSTGVSTESSGS